MWEGALKCLFRFLLRSEVTKGLNFILATSASAMATEGKISAGCFWFCKFCEVNLNETKSSWLIFLLQDFRM